MFADLCIQFAVGARFQICARGWELPVLAIEDFELMHSLLKVVLTICCASRMVD